MRISVKILFKKKKNQELAYSLSLSFSHTHAHTENKLNKYIAKTMKNKYIMEWTLRVWDKCL